MNNQLNMSRVKRLWLTQIGITLFLAVLCALSLDLNAGTSALLGGMVCIIPNIFLAQKLFKYRGARAAKQIVKSFYQGEALKIIISVFLFTVVFIVWSIKPLIFFASYILMQQTYWFSPWIIDNKQNRQVK